MMPILVLFNKWSINLVTALSEAEFEQVEVMARLLFYTAGGYAGQ
jgi:hypothetical protein